MSKPRRIREGFPGQRMLVLPKPVVEAALGREGQLDLLPTDVGHFPAAAWHSVERAKGIDRLIVILCLRGEGWARVDGRAFAVQQGHALLVGRGRPHAYGSDGDAPWTIAWVHVSGRQLDAIEPMLNLDGSAVIPVSDIAALAELAEDVHRTLLRSWDAQACRLASLTTGYLLARLAMARRESTEAGVEARLDRAISHMRKRVDAHVSVPELARIASLSCAHFSATFKRHAGHPPLEYFLRLKMHRAAQLLDTTDKSVKQVAAELGYADPLYFSRRFSGVHGRSPTQYRSIRKG